MTPYEAWLETDPVNPDDMDAFHAWCDDQTEDARNAEHERGER